MARSGIGDRLEGLHAVAAALRAGRVEELWVESGRLDRPEVAGLVEEARASGVEVHVVGDVRSMAISAVPQGVVAAAEPLALHALEDLVGTTHPPAVVVLDHLEDPHNVGATARSLLAAGIRALVVPTRRAAPLGATAFKAASGALEHVRVATVSSTADAVRRLTRVGLWTVGLSAAGDRSLFGLELLGEPVALVVGSEGAGLGRLVEERVDVRARIPLVGETESLNASVAAALAAYELARVRGWV